MPTIHDRGDIDIHDVTLLENVAVGNPVADYIVDARAAGLGISEISERGRLVLVPDRVFMDQAVDFLCGNTGLHKGANVIHELGIEFPGAAHPVPL